VLDVAKRRDNITPERHSVFQDLQDSILKSDTFPENAFMSSTLSHLWRLKGLPPAWLKAPVMAMPNRIGSKMHRRLGRSSSRTTKGYSYSYVTIFSRTPLTKQIPIESQGTLRGRTLVAKATPNLSNLQQTDLSDDKHVPFLALYPLMLKISHLRCQFS
jgi:hypothetical protein